MREQLTPLIEAVRRDLPVMGVYALALATGVAGAAVFWAGC